MKKLLALLGCTFTLPALAQVGLASKLTAAEDARQPPEGETLQWDAGGDFRIRQEIYGNLPQAHGKESDTTSYFRMRGRIWGKVENESFTFYTRFVDEFREYVQCSKRDFERTPGEVIPDNIYLDLRDLLWDRLDLRIGRQDLMYGSGRLISEGTPMDGSRSFYMDAIKATVKFDEKEKTDLLGIYDSAETFSWGEPHTVGDGPLPLNSMYPYAKDLVEWGSGVYHKSRTLDWLPFDVYGIYMNKSPYTMTSGARMQGRWVETYGARLMPKFSDEWSAELEGAGQYGQTQAHGDVGGWLGFGGLTYAPKVDPDFKPYVTASTLYLSCDSDRGTGKVGDEESDRAWDPLWSRSPMFISEMEPYQSIYGLAYWTNLIYPALEVGGKWERHSAFASAGPMFAAVQDDMGGGDSLYEGMFYRVRYDFPIWKDLFGKRGDLQGHVVAEVLDPGDYYASDDLAYFVRWEVSFKY